MGHCLTESTGDHVFIIFKKGKVISAYDYSFINKVLSKSNYIHHLRQYIYSTYVGLVTHQKLPGIKELYYYVMKIRLPEM